MGDLLCLRAKSRFGSVHIQSIDLGFLPCNLFLIIIFFSLLGAIPCAGSVDECIQRKQFIEDPKTKEPRIVVNGRSLSWSGLLVFGIAFPGICCGL